MGPEFNQQRVLEEVAVLVERSDVSEELARMTTHIEHFRELLSTGGEAGKKLDFLLQEMNREANTLLSKTAGISGKGTCITELGLAMKSEIEKAREQVQKETQAHDFQGARSESQNLPFSRSNLCLHEVSKVRPT